VRVPNRSTRDVVLRVKQVGELEARRLLEAARDEVAACKALRARAAAVLERAEERQRRAEAGGDWVRARAGVLATRAIFRGEARARVADAQAALLRAGRAFTAAERAVDRARLAVESAHRAREAAETQKAADDARDARSRSRRDQSAADDRWRPGTR
jgi:hypothetical protein